MTTAANDSGSKVEVSNSYLRDIALRTHSNLLIATVKEGVSNGISHTPDGVQSWQRHSIIHHDGVNSMLNAFQSRYNSDASRFLMQDPYDGSEFATIMNVGHNAKHKVKNNSQFNSGNTNQDYSACKAPHSERYFYNAAKKQGVGVVFTLPKFEKETGTRTRADQESNSKWSLGFTVDDTDPANPVVHLHQGVFAPESLQMFLLHSRLAGDISSDGFDPSYAKNCLRKFLLRTVIADASNPDVPGNTAFVHVVDLENTTYADPVTGAPTQCFSESEDDIIFTTAFHETNGTKALKHFSLKSYVQRQYLLPDCDNVRKWKCVNGYKLRGGLSSYDISIIVSGNKTVCCTTPVTAHEFKSVHNVTRRLMTNDSRLLTGVIMTESQPSDAISLDMKTPQMPGTLPVEFTFFDSSDERINGLLTMWRDDMNPATNESRKKLMSMQTEPIVPSTLYGINSAATKRGVFMQFMSSTGWEIEEEMTHKTRRLYFTKKGANEFADTVGHDPSVVLYSFEKWVTSDNGFSTANNARAYFYMFRTIVLLQLGNLTPDYNKSGCSENQNRWTAICQKAIQTWIKFMCTRFPMVCTVDDAKKAGFYTCKDTDISPVPAATPAAATPAAATPATASGASSSSDATPAVASSIAAIPLFRKRTAEDDAAQPAKKRPNNSVKNIDKCCKLITSCCDKFISLTAKYAQVLQRDAPGSDALNACNERIRRLQGLKHEANVDNHAVFVRAPPSFMLTTSNIDRVANIQVYWAVVGGPTQPELGLLNVDTMKELLSSTLYGNGSFSCLEVPQCNGPDYEILVRVCDRPGN
jgi:hypothetical protein